MKKLGIDRDGCVYTSVEEAAPYNAILQAYLLNESGDFLELKDIDSQVLEEISALDYEYFITILGEDVSPDIILHFAGCFKKNKEFDKLGACYFDLADNARFHSNVKDQRYYLSLMTSKMKEAHYLEALDFFAENGDESEFQNVKKALSEINVSDFTEMHLIESIAQKVANRAQNEEIKEKFNAQKLELSQSYIRKLLKIIK